MGVYSRMLRHARPYRKGWVLILALSVLSIAPGVLQPWPLKIFVDNVLGGARLEGSVAGLVERLPGDGRDALLAWTVAATIALFLLNALFDAALTLSWVRVGQRMVHDLAEQLFASLQQRSLALHGRTSVADSLTRITGDSWSVNTVVGTLLLGPTQAAISTAVMIALMSKLDGFLTCLALAVAPFMVSASLLLGRRLRETASTRRRLDVELKAHVHRTLSGIQLVQAFTRETLEQRRFREIARAALQSQLSVAFARGLSQLSSGLIATVGTGVVLFAGARRVLDERLSVGGLLVFLAYLKSLQAQFGVFAGIYGTLQRTAPSIERVVELLDSEPAVRESPDARPLEAARGHVRFAGVSFGYEPSRAVLQDVELEARPGETVAVVGATGAGKSTLLSLLLRFYDPWHGHIELDGRDLRDLRLRDLRAQISVVLQEPFLFPLSIAENIAYSRPGASRAAIVAAARSANAHAFVEALPHGYDTVIGERGATLSGGEKQRIAIARALLKDAPVLILDEPTSALDAGTERLLLEALERLSSGRTTFVIAHRLSTIRRADKILVLKDGRIAETGSHRELLSKKNHYAELCAAQFGDAELGASVSEGA